MRFDIHVPTRIHFGCGILEDALCSEKQYLQGNVLLVSSRSMVKRGIAERIVRCLRQLRGIENVFVFDSITSNPKINEVNKGIFFAIEHEIQAVIGVGGGSVLDAAKAIALGAGAKEKIDSYFFKNILPGINTLPILAIPTTAGTGSELSKSSILSSPKDQIKTGVRGQMLYPKAAIVDPELTYSVPLKITMDTGFDVMAHAVETYLSKASNAFTNALSEQAIKIVSNSLPRLAENIDCISDREKMCYASMIMGINLGNASTCLPHRMQYPIGAMTDTGHGEGLQALYPSWIFHTYQYSPEKFNRIAQLMSGRACNSCDEVLKVFTSWMDTTCGRPSLEKLGVSRTDKGKLATMVTGNISLDPAGSEEGIIEKIYATALQA